MCCMQVCCTVCRPKQAERREGACVHVCVCVCVCVSVCVSVYMCVCVCVYRALIAECERRTCLTLWSMGCSQSVLTSQWLSRKVRTGAEAAPAPRTLERISPGGGRVKEERGRRRRGECGEEMCAVRHHSHPPKQE